MPGLTSTRASTKNRQRTRTHHGTRTRASSDPIYEVLDPVIGHTRIASIWSRRSINVCRGRSLQACNMDGGSKERPDRCPTRPRPRNGPTDSPTQTSSSPHTDTDLIHTLSLRAAGATLQLCDALLEGSHPLQQRGDKLCIDRRHPGRNTISTQRSQAYHKAPITGNQCKHSCWHFPWENRSKPVGKLHETA